MCVCVACCVCCVCIEGHWRISDSCSCLLGEATQVSDARHSSIEGVPVKVSTELAPVLLPYLLSRFQCFSHKKAGKRGSRENTLDLRFLIGKDTTRPK